MADFLQAAEWLNQDRAVRRHRGDGPVGHVYRLDEEGFIVYVPPTHNEERVMQLSFRIEDVLADDWVYMAWKDGKVVEMDDGDEIEGDEAEAEE